MKNLLILLLPLLLFANKPTWFYNIKDQNNRIIGYGVSENLYEAKKYAIDEISKKINLNIDSTTNISKSINNKIYEKNINSNIDIKSKNSLNNINFFKIEQVDKFWYVAAYYKKDLIFDRVKHNLSSYTQEESIKSNFLKHSPLVNSLNKYTNKSIDYKLFYKDNLWYLKYKEFSEILTQDDFYELFYNLDSEEFLFQTNKKSFDSGDYLQFSINSKTPGYFTLFDIDYSGNVGIVLSNKFIKSTFDSQNKDDFTIVNRENHPIKELFILVKTTTPLKLYEFEKIQDKFLDENSRKFHKLIDYINDKLFISKVIHISKGY